MSFRIRQDADTAAEAFAEAQTNCITDIDLPAISATELGHMRALTRVEYGRDYGRDYARSLPAVTPESVIACPECDGVGSYLTGCMSPDDLIEERCALCLGTGLLDVADAPTIVFKRNEAHP